MRVILRPGPAAGLVEEAVADAEARGLVDQVLAGDPAAWGDHADAARAWGSHPDHSATQSRGRAEYYQDYTLYTCDNPRTHHYERPQS